MGNMDNYDDENSMFNDFSILENGDTEIDEDAIEAALRNIAAQMSADAPDTTLNSTNEEKTEAIEEPVQEESSEEPVQNEALQEETSEETPNDNNEASNENIEENIQEDFDNKNEADLLNEEAKENYEEKSEQDLKNEEADNDAVSEQDFSQNLSPWEELDDSNSVVKKYIVYISKDFVPYIDELSVDQRSAYINDAIQIKLDALDIEKQKIAKRNALIHTLIAAAVVIILTPIALFISHKAIMATFENYKYSQENFEKLYKHRFEKDKAYMRSVEYNKAYQKKVKKSN